MAKKKKRQFICDDHDDIDHYLNLLVPLIREHVEGKRPKNRMLKIIKDLRETLAAAKHSGIRMEKRLEHYREAMEYLGYKRDKKKG